MTPAEVASAKTKLDVALAGKSENIGVAFGYEIFRDFVGAGHIKKEKFGALGTTLFAEMVPAYDKTHFAFVDWELDDKDFKAG